MARLIQQEADPQVRPANREELIHQVIVSQDLLLFHRTMEIQVPIRAKEDQAVAPPPTVLLVQVHSLHTPVHHRAQAAATVAEKEDLQAQDILQAVLPAVVVHQATLQAGQVRAVHPIVQDQAAVVLHQEVVVHQVQEEGDKDLVIPSSLLNLQFH